MADREKILYELEHQVADADWCDNDWKDNVPVWMLRGALALLREQEPVKPKKVNRYIDFDDEGHPYSPETYDCGNCGKELPWKANYCSNCGRKVSGNDDKRNSK